jgi:hypothetical protein
LLIEEDFTMRQRSEFAILLMGLTVLATLTAPLAMAQNAAPPPLKDQLEAQYRLSSVYTDGRVNPAGTILVVQMDGIHGFPPDNAVVAPATYKNGTLHAPSGGSRFLTRAFDAAARPGNSTSGSDSRPLRVGEKVYVTKIDISLKNKKQDTVRFSIVECGACNGVDQTSSYKALVDFEFAKGYLQPANTSDIEDTIAKVFAIDTSGPPAQAAQTGSQPDQPATGQQAPPQPPTPTQIQLGQTIDEVVNALGQPEKIVDLGTKKIYVYKDLKITFVNGKVSDVQ